MLKSLSSHQYNNSNDLSQSTSPKFYPKPAHFEHKQQIAPNWLIFNPNLSDASVRFLLALNGIATCSTNWIPQQSDLQKRLGWGRDKMRNAIKECIEFGYLRVKKIRNKKGEFDRNDFEFCMEASFKNSLPHTENPSTDKPAVVNPPLLVIQEELVPLEQLVCVDSPPVAASPPEKDHEKIVKKKFDGTSFEVSKNDLFTSSIQKWKDWTEEEIDEAWKILSEYQDPIRNWFSFCEGTIKNLRKLSGLKNLNIQENSCQNKKNQNPSTSSHTKTTNSESENSKKETSTNVMWEQVYPDWRSQLGLPPKFSTT